MGRFRTALAIWLPIVIATTAVCGLVYVTVQQALRQSANDPQIQMAEDAAYALGGGAPAESVVSPDRIDVARSLAPFTVVFNDNGQVLASSGLLHRQPLTLPAGVLDNVRLHGDSRLTLQPEFGVRIASVIVKYDGSRPGFVLAGRSMRELEARTAQMRIFVAIAWIVVVGVSLLVISTFCSGSIWQ
jgi:hypothetical protein